MAGQDGSDGGAPQHEPACSTASQWRLIDRELKDLQAVQCLDRLGSWKLGLDFGGPMDVASWVRGRAGSRFAAAQDDGLVSIYDAI